MKRIIQWAGFILLSALLFVGLGPAAASAATIGVPFAIAGATLGANMLTLADWAKRVGPDGKIARVIEQLTQYNEILDDMVWTEGNLQTGMRTTIRTGLPTVYWRLINQGTPPSKSTSAQVDEQCAKLEAWSEIDEALVEIAADAAAFRDSEAAPFREAMVQKLATALFYGNSSVDPEQFNGLSVRYSSLSAGNAMNIINAGGVGSDNTSIWLVGWGPETVTGIFPKGSQAGLQHKDWGLGIIETTAGIAGSRMAGYREQWKWDVGIAVRDWRYVVRIANIDMSLLVGNDASSPKLFQLLTKAIHRIPKGAAARYAFYANRSVSEYLDIQGQDRVSSGGQMGYNVIDGKRIVSFAGIPIRTVDTLIGIAGGAGETAVA